MKFKVGDKVKFKPLIKKIKNQKDKCTYIYDTIIKIEIVTNYFKEVQLYEINNNNYSCESNMSYYIPYKKIIRGILDEK